MKKYFVALMVLTIALALVACGGTGADTTVEQGTEPPVTEHVHNFVEEITPATCTAMGKVVSKCECGEIQSESDIPLADHAASAFDCEKDTVCTVCNAVLAEKTGHSVAGVEVVTEASCTTPGKEKGACSVCGKIIETDIPVAGHKANKESKWELVDGGFKTTCAVCNQTVTMKEADVVLNLTFEEEIESELTKYSGFKNAGPYAYIDDTDGDKALKATTCYLDVVDNSVISKLGTYVISFDVMVTGDSGKDTDEASVFSILGNFESGKTNVGGTTSWGYAFKFNEGADKFETKKVSGDYSKLNSSNSIAVERNVKYNVQLLVAEGSNKFLVYFNGKSYGTSEGSVASFEAGKKNSLRFGDGPNCGLVFDNFKIAGLK